jgi:GrpB-like predicted nucleotidyltransferase (UPF0157 family)
MDLNESIHLENYNPKWQEFFAAEQAKLEDLLINHPEQVYLEHIGSTAIPNMTAKPIIDILVGVATFPPDSLFIKKIESLGYEFMASGSVAERLYFIKRSKIFFNIQVVKYNTSIWIKNILFRNFLTTHPEKASAPHP